MMDSPRFGATPRIWTMQKNSRPNTRKSFIIIKKLSPTSTVTLFGGPVVELPWIIQFLVIIMAVDQAVALATFALEALPFQRSTNYGLDICWGPDPRSFNPAMASMTNMMRGLMGMDS